MQRIPFSAWVLSIGLMTRLSAVLWLRDTVPYTDFVLYHAAGSGIAHDLGYLLRRSSLEALPQLNWWPPLYPLFLGLLYGFLGVDHRIAVFAQVALGSLTCWFVYRVGQAAAGEQVGRVAGLFVALNPSYIFVTNQLASENLFVFLFSASLFLTLHARQARSFAGSGIVLALAALTRAVGVFVPFVVALWLRTRARTRRVWLQWAACLLGAVFATLLPWSIRNLVLLGSPAPVSLGGGLNFYFGHNAVAMGFRELDETPLAGLKSPVAIDRQGYRLGLEYIAEDPIACIFRSAVKLRDLLGFPDYALHINSGILVPDFRTHPELKPLADERLARQRRRDRLLHGFFTDWARIHTVVLLLSAVAGVLLWRQLPPDLRLMVWLTLAWLLVHIVFWAQPRFRLPAEIPLSLLASFAWIWLARRIRVVGAKEH